MIYWIIDDIMNTEVFLFLHYIEQVDFILPWVCSVIDHRRCQNVVGASVTHRFLFLPYFVLIYDLLLNRGILTWTLSGGHPQQWLQLSTAQYSYRVYALDIMAVILVFENNETAAMLVYQTNPVRVQLFSYIYTFFCSDQ